MKASPPEVPLTIENPAVEARLRAFATARGTSIDEAITALLDGAEERPLTDDDLVAIRTGIDQLDRGEGVDGVDFLKDLRQRDGLTPREMGFTRRDAA